MNLRRLGLVAIAAFGIACGGDSSESSEPLPGCEGSGVAAAHCPGATAPSWQLRDVQPASARYEQRYGLAELRDQVVLLVVLSAWCPYCQAQATELEKLAAQLKEERIEDVQLLIMNTSDAAEDVAKLTERTSVPIVQDEASVSAAKMHNARKDDLLIYGKDGTLISMYAAGSARDLRNADNFAAIKRALLDAR